MAEMRLRGGELPQTVSALFVKNLLTIVKSFQTHPLGRLEGRGSRWGLGEESGSQLVELPIGDQWRRDLAGVVCCQLRVGEEARWPSRRGLR